MALLTVEQQDLRKLVAEFAAKEIAPHAAEYDRTEEFPWDNIKRMAQLGLLGLPLPEKYGGSEVDTVSYVAALEEISKACAATGAIMAIHISAGIMPIYLFGTEEQKLKYIPDLANGRRLGAFALTEPNAGSDASRVQTLAVLVGTNYVLNGTKCFISNGGPAGVYTVFASLDRTKALKESRPSLSRKALLVFRSAREKRWGSGPHLPPNLSLKTAIFPKPICSVKKAKDSKLRCASLTAPASA